MSLVPYVVEQTARGERSYDIFSRLLNDRIIVLSEDVNPTSASVVIAQLLYLEGQDPEKDISFYINSPGGSISDGMAIHDTMKYIKCDVSTICVVPPDIMLTQLPECSMLQHSHSVGGIERQFPFFWLRIYSATHYRLPVVNKYFHG